MHTLFLSDAAFYLLEYIYNHHIQDDQVKQYLEIMLKSSTVLLLNTYWSNDINIQPANKICYPVMDHYEFITPNNVCEQLSKYNVISNLMSLFQNNSILWCYCHTPEDMGLGYYLYNHKKALKQYKCLKNYIFFMPCYRRYFKNDLCTVPSLICEIFQNNNFIEAHNFYDLSQIWKETKQIIQNLYLIYKQ